MTVAVDPYLIDWLDFLLRWLHVIAGIVWIGTSFYFVALDNHLHPPARPEDAEAGIARRGLGDARRRLLSSSRSSGRSAELPEPLHWYKWEAYTTWLSGFALFASSTTSMRTSTRRADTQSRGHRALARAAGRGLARLRRALPAAPERARPWRRARRARHRNRIRPQPRLPGSRRLAPARRDARHDHGRERLLRDHPGALGSRPGEGGRARARSQRRGSAASSAPSTTTTSRSRCSSRCSAITSRSPMAHADGWLVLVCLMLVGAWIRHYFNLRHAGRTAWWIPATAAAGARRHRHLDQAA